MYGHCTGTVRALYGHCVTEAKAWFCYVTVLISSVTSHTSEVLAVASPTVPEKLEGGHGAGDGFSSRQRHARSLLVE